MKEKKSNFSGSIGFVLAAAGSAVGVGNIWRFPYLCAKDGGGLFLIVYLALVLSFGFVLLTTDIAIGRHTKQNALKAFGTLNSKWKFLGYLTFLVPALIMTYYSVIGGWITKYFCTYLVSDGSILSQDSYFTSFITSKVSPIVFMLLFLALTAWVVYRGVEKGIEKFSRFIMPGLILLILGCMLLLGAFMDCGAAMAIIVPLVYPILVSYGLDPYTSIVSIIICQAVGLCSPLCGLCLLVMSPIAECTIGELGKHVIKLSGLLVLVAVIVVLLPGLFSWATAGAFLP